MIVTFTYITVNEMKNSITEKQLVQFEIFNSQLDIFWRDKQYYMKLKLKTK